MAKRRVEPGETHRAQNDDFYSPKRIAVMTSSSNGTSHSRFMSSIKRAYASFGEKFQLQSMHQYFNIQCTTRNKEKHYLSDPMQFLHLLKSQHRSLLVEGAPGSGKTMLCLYLCSEWAAGNILLEYEYVVLVLLNTFGSMIVRAADVQEDQKKVEVMIKPYCSAEICSEAAKEICLKQEKVLFILDGVDELPQECARESSFVHELLSRSLLTKSSVIITSAPYTASHLYSNIVQTNRLRLLSLTDSQVNAFLSANSPNAADVQAHLRNCPYIDMYAHTPLILFMLCAVACVFHKLPVTKTQLYTQYIIAQLQEYLEEERTDIPTEIDHLPSRALHMIHNLCKLAAEGVKEGKYVFPMDQLVLHKGELKMRKSGLYFQCYFDRENMFGQFMHSSIQHFLAAYHIQELAEEEQLQLVRRIRNSTRMTSMCKYIAGNSSSMPIQDVVINTTVQGSSDDQLLLLHCMFEMNNAETCHRAAKYMDRNLQFSNRLLSVADCSCIGFFIEKTKGQWFLQFRGCKLGINEIDGMLCYLVRQCVPSEEFIIKVLDVGCNQDKSTQPHSLGIVRLVAGILERNILLVELDISQNRDIGENGLQTLAETLSYNKSLLFLKMRTCNVSGSGAIYIAEMLKRNTVLKDLLITNNELGDDGVGHLANALKQNVALETLDVGYNKMSLKGFSYLCDMLKVNHTLVTLCVFGSNLDFAGCELLIQSLVFNHTLLRIDMRKNPLKDVGIEVLVNGLLTNSHCQLCHLGFYGCAVTDKGVQALCRLIKANKLKGIQLGLNNGITDQSANLLSEALRENSTLKQLRLEKTSMTEFGRCLLEEIKSVDITFIDNLSSQKQPQQKSQKTISVASCFAF